MCHAMQFKLQTDKCELLQGKKTIQILCLNTTKDFCVYHCTYSWYHNDEDASNPSQNQSWSAGLLPSDPVHRKTTDKIRGDFHRT